MKLTFIVVLLCSGISFLMGQWLFSLLFLGFLFISWNNHESVEHSRSETEINYNTGTSVVLTIALFALIMFLLFSGAGASVGGDDGEMLRALLGE